MNLDSQNNDLVSYSRAGDVFHYRWAARRCLKLIQPTSNLESVFIEGSNERKKAGEYVIDVSEYYNDNQTKNRIEYYQLKHTTLQQDKPFTLSKLKDTIVGFAERYKQHSKEKSLSGVSFTIITNRKIDETFKQNISSISGGGDKVNNRFVQTIKKYTELKGKKLMQFCSLLNFADSEGDYLDQEGDLMIEMSRLQPGMIDTAQVDSIVSLVQRKVLPDSNGKIIKEDILRPFGVTSIGQLFPAPPLFEELDKITHREQYLNIVDRIKTADQPTIIQAGGGVGKSVFSQYVLQVLPEGSLGIAYDCFGSGKYRSRSKPRHRHRDALVQIANELASLGHCDSMVIKDTTQESDIVLGFLSRIESSIKSLKQIVASAQLYILIDAADNAEMAAKEFGNSCFANELLKEDFPHDCKLVYLCRPERTHLLKPSSSISLLNLQPFSIEETFENLKKHFQEANENQALEFHRLTSGNPRVQMNAISAGHASINELLEFLGPSGTSVEQQIEDQLNAAVNKIKDNLTSDYQSSVDKICKGLASLPPNIPLEVLAKASEVSIEEVKSFIIDIGRSLWMRDSSSVHFRDEPTETWFRKTFLSTEEDFRSYVEILEPLASYFTYVAEILPQLYLQAGQYDDLIEIALSDKLLPASNPIDKRNVLVYRLQFAFKAALRSANYKDAIQLALRAGEEVAGDQRQQSLFQNNIDLLPKLQDDLKVQEVAFKKILRSSWEGSENIYTASLLSEIKEFNGDAQGYLRSAMNWLHMYFEESKKKNDRYRENGISREDILELAYVFLNLNGAKSCLKFLDSIKPKEFIFEVVRQLVNRLIDSGRFDEIDQILKNARENKFHVVAIVSELVKVGRFAEADDIEKCLKMLSNSKMRIKKPKDSYHDNLTPSIVGFLEVCLHRMMEDSLITKTLDYYVPNVASQGAGSRYESKESITFLKALSIRCVISKISEINLDDLMPKVYKSEDKKRSYSDDIKEFKEVIGGLFPWYLLRAQLISGDIDDLANKAKQADEDSKRAIIGRYRSYDDLPKEIAGIQSSILIYCKKLKLEAIQQYFKDYLQNNSSFTIGQRIHLLRAGNRANHLNSVLTEIESSTYKMVRGLKESRPEEVAGGYISLARAVLSSSKDDAAVYFEDAIDIISKFGDEIVERWEAVESLGKASNSHSSDELAYRFVRCAELVGENVYREKHWNRSRAIVTCVNMSPQIGISALSRWRDREIGEFEYQLEDILRYLVKSKVISPDLGWSLARFLPNYNLLDFLSICLINGSSFKERNKIFNDAFEWVRKEGATTEYWMQMKLLADQYKIRNSDLNNVVNSFETQIKSSKPSELEKDKEEVANLQEGGNWDIIFRELDVLTPSGVSTLLKRYNLEIHEKQNHIIWDLSDLYTELFLRIDPKDILRLVDSFLYAENIGYYDYIKFLSFIPNEWKSKVSFNKKWPEIIKKFGARFAYDLVYNYSYESAIRDLNIDDDLSNELRKGIFQRLSQGQEFTNASILFRFVQHASAFIDASQAANLLDYALSRFEIHIEDDFGDGPWNKWLHVSDDIDRNIAGFIWSSLGSPRSETRWKACHVIKKLADFGCANVLKSLLEWLEYDQVDAFGSKKYPFYNLHARQYLLIAFSRVSIDAPEVLVDYKGKFQKYSHLEPHVLIQKFASEIALNIEKAIPGTYSCREISNLEGVGKSKFKAKKEKYGYRTDSYLHQKGEVNTNIEFNFGWDFDEYWFKPLGEVFGVPGKQIQDLCADVVYNKWGLETKTGYNNDPRVNLWNRSQERDTWHTHSEYPKADNWDFYISYHSMLIVAAKLVENMTVLIEEYDDGLVNEWESWLSGHILTLNDGRWLADLRDPLPINKPDWVNSNLSKEWINNIKDDDLLKYLSLYNDEGNWLNVYGEWSERKEHYHEECTINSSLVLKETSSSLQKSLLAVKNFQDYKLPNFGESNFEISEGKFQLKGWINEPYYNNGIDRFDPYAVGIKAPLPSIGEAYMELLKITPDPMKKTWHLNKNDKVFKLHSWSSALKYEIKPERSGIRITGEIEILKTLCQELNCCIIIEITLRREIDSQFRPKDYKFIPAKHKIFLLTDNGTIKE
ncbi:ATP-binding protein [Mangrovivirga cuniculi]|uniref:ATP-binding protein n=1 Tax=Mangrovivirga cuniculi TaxID=2715131 RepID=A0A4D7K775_9BACT|nr:ATP-binding protein [Mangrovivirga cuniculi]QCK15228.1 ATP-binding protein [Mangrovivirga cuniculi]